MFKYKVNLDPQLIDLDELMSIFKGGVWDGRGADLRRELRYEVGDAGYKFIVDTLQAQVDNIKARQPSATE